MQSQGSALSKVLWFWPLALVLVAALLVRLDGLDSGLPYVYSWDEGNNLSRTITMLRERDLNPHWFHYGSLMFYLNAVVIGTIQMLRTGLGQAGGLADLEMPQLVADGSGRLNETWLLLAPRATSVLLSVATVALIYIIVLKLTKRRWSAFFAAVLFALAPIAVSEGRLFTPNVLSGFLAAAAIGFAIRIYERGEMRDYVLAGALVGLAAGAKYNAGLVGVAVVVAHWLRVREGETTTLRGFLIAIYSAVGAFLITTPFAALDPETFFYGVRTELFHYATGHVGDQGMGGLIGALGVSFSASLLLVPWALGRIRAQPVILIVTSFAAVYLSLLLIARTTFPRNLLPLLPALCIVIGVSAVAFLDGGTARSRIAALSVVISVSASVAASSLLGEGEEQIDRSIAVAWIAENIPRQTSIVIDAYSPWVDPSAYQVTSPGLVVIEPLPPQWEVLLLTEAGSGRYQGGTGRLSDEAERLKTLKETTCLVKHFPGVVEVRTPDCDQLSLDLSPESLTLASG